MSTLNERLLEKNIQQHSLYFCFFCVCKNFTMFRCSPKRAMVILSRKKKNVEYIELNMNVFINSQCFFY